MWKKLMYDDYGNIVQLFFFTVIHILLDIFLPICLLLKGLFNYNIRFPVELKFSTLCRVCKTYHLYTWSNKIFSNALLSISNYYLKIFFQAELSCNIRSGMFTSYGTDICPLSLNKRIYNYVWIYILRNTFQRF